MRYEIRSGKFGYFFYDTAGKYPMELETVLDKLNRIDALKLRLAKANAKYPKGEF